MDYLKTPLAEYITDLASRKVSPGGGSASALVAALGAALNTMVINFGISPRTEPDKSEELSELKERQTVLMREAMNLINEDCEVFTALMDAISRKTVTSERYVTAADVPIRICRVSRESARISLRLLDLVKGCITADIACAGIILCSAFYSARVNVESNLKRIGPGDVSSKLSGELLEMEAGIESDFSSINRRLRETGVLKTVRK